MDTLILLYTLFSFSIFFAAQFIVFRFIDEDRALMWLVKLYFLIEGVSLIVGFAVLPSESYVMIAVWHFVIFTLLVAAYMAGIFSFTEASITIQLLTQIAKGGKKGLTKAHILQSYNPKMIVQRRLSRFIAGGDIVRQGSSYRWRSVFSPFILREHAFFVFQIFFPRMTSLG